ncbi:MAG: glycine cleavage system protein R [Dissulfurispiraceae bacterium]
MKKIVVFVLGPDRPGIIATISKILFEQGCNLEDVSQTILQREFMGIFIVSMESKGSEAEVLSALQAQLKPSGLFVHLRPMEGSTIVQQPPGESFIITTVGPDRPGLVAGITDVLAHYKVNITNLKAVAKEDQHGQNYVMIYEVDIPPATDHHSFRIALYDRARKLSLDINLQHREIFEQIHRV